ncbi:MAG: ribose 5-phosphate isomerase B [Ignavibacteria bacterium]|nr:ribose 5-phosphate isomerase B [Ignavibacteria bacterium]MCU7504051.1 ribose 5-phosphate isomerase B [Ignavibacteria bacterium]MCU7515423.1 ribose 5-phosphate isomerase B [Ignavibacteria bacterium]
MDKIKALGFSIVRREDTASIEAEAYGVKPSEIRLNRVAIGSDHTGFYIKGVLSKMLMEKSYGVIDVGTYDETSCDYPDFALSVAQNVMEKKADFGVLIDATGIPSAIVANKLPGIRAATCYNELSARSAREHNNANIIAVGARALGEEAIKSILEAFILAAFSGGRHQRRLDKISAIEEKFMKMELKSKT